MSIKSQYPIKSPVKSTDDIVFDKYMLLLIRASINLLPLETKREIQITIKERKTSTQDETLSRLIGQLVIFARYTKQSERTFIKKAFNLDNSDMKFLMEELP